MAFGSLNHSTKDDAITYSDGRENTGRFLMGHKVTDSVKTSSLLSSQNEVHSYLLPILGQEIKAFSKLKIRKKFKI